nr:MAG TPA: hypothetical protein [Caudoviricetes sp.]
MIHDNETIVVKWYKKGVKPNESRLNILLMN